MQREKIEENIEPFIWNYLKKERGEKLKENDRLSFNQPVGELLVII